MSSSPDVKFLACTDPDGRRTTIGPCVTPSHAARVRGELETAGFTDITEIPAGNCVPMMTVVDFRHRYGVRRST